MFKNSLNNISTKFGIDEIFVSSVEKKERRILNLNFLNILWIFKTFTINLIPMKRKMT